MVGEIGLPYCLSTAGSVPIEAAPQVNAVGALRGVERYGQNGNAAQYADDLRHYQLHMPHYWDLGRSLLQRAHDRGYDACVFTVDTWSLGWRHDDVATSKYTFYKGIATDLGTSDPVSMRRMREQGVDTNDAALVGERW